MRVLNPLGVLKALGVLSIIVLLIWLIVLAVRRARRIRAEWLQYVDGVGAEVLGGGFPECRLRFQRDQIPVEVHQWSETSGHGDDRSTTYYSEIRTWPLLPGLEAIRIGPEGFFAKVGKFFGMEDLQIGEADFDAAFIVHAPSVELVKSLLKPEARQALVAAHASLNGISLDEGALCWKGDLFERPVDADRQVDALVELAKKIA